MKKHETSPHLRTAQYTLAAEVRLNLPAGFKFSSTNVTAFGSVFVTYFLLFRICNILPHIFCCQVVDLVHGKVVTEKAAATSHALFQSGSIEDLPIQTLTMVRL